MRRCAHLLFILSPCARLADYAQQVVVDPPRALVLASGGGSVVNSPDHCDISLNLTADHDRSYCARYVRCDPGLDPSHANKRATYTRTHAAPLLTHVHTPHRSFCEPRMDMSMGSSTSMTLDESMDYLSISTTAGSARRPLRGIQEDAANGGDLKQPSPRRLARDSGGSENDFAPPLSSSTYLTPILQQRVPLPTPYSSPYPHTLPALLVAASGVLGGVGLKPGELAKALLSPSDVTRMMSGSHGDSLRDELGDLRTPDSSGALSVAGHLAQSSPTPPGMVCHSRSQHVVSTPMGFLEPTPLTWCFANIALQTLGVIAAYWPTS